jgi:hypothetical protein
VLARDMRRQELCGGLAAPGAILACAKTASIGDRSKLSIP